MSYSLLCHRHREENFVSSAANSLLINKVVLPIFKNSVRELKLSPIKHAYNVNKTENDKGKPNPKGDCVSEKRKKEKSIVGNMRLQPPLEKSLENGTGIMPLMSQIVSGGS